MESKAAAESTLENASTLPPPSGEAILPLPVVSTENWRMIHFKYKKKRSIMHVQDGFEVASPMKQQQQHVSRRDKVVCIK